MVVLHNFSDIFEDLSKQSNLSLPKIKETFIKIGFENLDNNETVYNGQEPPLPFAASEVFHARISSWRCLTAKDADCKTVYEVTFHITGKNTNFRPGDTIGLIPRNLAAEVDAVIDHLDLASVVDFSYRLTVNSGQKGAKIPPHIPIKSTLRHVLTHCVDLRGVVKKLFLLALSTYTTNKSEQKLLEYFCSKEGSAAYTTHILNKNLCILDLFKIFKTCKPP